MKTWAYLCQGETVAVSLEKAKEDFEKVLPDAFYLTDIGDGQMTLHNTVYGGIQGQWFRPL